MVERLLELRDDHVSYFSRRSTRAEHIHEYSRYYFIDSKNKEVFKQASSLNNKGDAFYHSLYIKSKLFDSFDFQNIDENQATTSEYSTASEEFKYLMEKANKYLREKRRPFLKK